MDFRTDALRMSGQLAGGCRSAGIDEPHRIPTASRSRHSGPEWSSGKLHYLPGSPMTMTRTHNVGGSIKRPRLLVEEWLPTAAIGVECTRERSTGQQPPYKAAWAAHGSE